MLRAGWAASWPGGDSRLGPGLGVGTFGILRMVPLSGDLTSSAGLELPAGRLASTDSPGTWINCGAAGLARSGLVTAERSSLLAYCFSSHEAILF